MKIIDNLAKKYQDNKFALKYIWPMYNKFYKSPKVNRDFRKNGLEALNDVCKILEKYNIQYWLEFGTLLGYYREGDFIQHDNDIDLGILYSSWTDEVEEEFKSQGIRLIREISIDDKDYKALEKTFSYLNVNLDFFFFFELEGSECRSNSFFCDSNKAFRDFTQEGKGLDVVEELLPMHKKLNPVEFKTIKVNVPDNIKERLVIYYGESFMIPDSSFIPSFNERRRLLKNRIGKIKIYE